MSRTTTALVLTKFNGPFELREVQLDEIRPDEALVEIHASAICHTDLSCAHGNIPFFTPPVVLGHEGAGIVLEAGSEVMSVSKGDKVLLSFTHCETCSQCSTGHPGYCYDFNKRNFGGKRPDGSSAMLTTGELKPIASSFFGQSSWARHTLVHRSCLVRVPPETNLELYAPLGCGMQTGAGAVINTLNVRPGSTLVVFGTGGVGMSAVMAGKICGAKTIIAVDLHQSRLDLAKQLGATHTILGSDQDVVQQIQKLCPPVGADFAVDTTGVPAVVGTMIDALGMRGRGATVGTPGPGIRAGIEIMGHLAYGKEYVGCSEGDSLPSEFIPYLMDQHAKGKYPLEELITYYDIKDYDKAIQDTATGKTIKAVLRWS